MAAGWLFVFIGAAPRTEWLDGTVLRDNRGFVLVRARIWPRTAGCRRDGNCLVRRYTWKRVCPACSWPATSAPNPPSGLPRPSARVPWP